MIGPTSLKENALVQPPTRMPELISVLQSAISSGYGVTPKWTGASLRNPRSPEDLGQSGFPHRLGKLFDPGANNSRKKISLFP